MERIEKTGKAGLAKFFNAHDARCGDGRWRCVTGSVKVGAQLNASAGHLFERNVKR